MERIERLAGHLRPSAPLLLDALSSKRVSGDNSMDAIRQCFPSLLSKSGVPAPAYFDGPGGSQTPSVVANAMARVMTSGISNRGGGYPASDKADKIVTEFREAVADLLDAPSPKGVIFGRSWTSLCYDMARNLSRGWKAGDGVMVTNLDHDSNIRPWVQAVERCKGVQLTTVKFDPKTGRLDPEIFRKSLQENAEKKIKTRLVALTGASNILGTRPDIKAIASIAHQYGALVWVDAVHLTPHAVVSMKDLNVDFLGCSSYKWFGPHAGVLAVKPQILEKIPNDRLRPMKDYPHPDRFEFGTLPFEILAGITAAIEFIAAIETLLASPASSSSFMMTRRERIVRSMTLVQEHEKQMRLYAEKLLSSIPQVLLHACKAPVRTPTIYFSVKGVPSKQVFSKLAGMGVYVGAGHFYAMDAADHLGLGAGGAVRAGIMAYTSRGDIQRLVDGVKAIVDGRG
mmetsp:Transcript_10078/g.19705  ORF Transcript_10078/g.19705 Transcript_10078/m.19705 type:complete len:456 (-) Transcript_10078:125-1492(-)